MSLTARKNTLIGLLLAVIVVLSAVCFIVIQSVHAQDMPQHQNMRALLETLNQRIKTDADFQVTFKFAQPLMDNDEVFWEIPYYPQDQDIYRNIGEIGDDFVCFYEMAGSSDVARCTPFSNIVSVGYVDNP